MKRLTERYKNGTVYNVSETKERAVDRLAAIEDILGDEYDLNLVQRLIQAYKEGRYIIMKEPEQAGVSRLRELAQADRSRGKKIETVLPKSDAKDESLEVKQ